MVLRFRGMLLILIVSLPLRIWPQGLAPSFEHISIGHGFFQSTINAIYQDRTGFLWFCTNDGLCRYDGYSFKMFRHNPSDIHSISENNITAITEDQSGNIWIGTSSGYLNKYSRQNHKFTSYKLTYHPLFIRKEVQGAIPFYYSSYALNSVTSIICDQYGYIWAGTSGSGLFLFDHYENKFTQYYYTEGEKSISSDFVLSIAEDKKGNIWIGTLGGGLNKIPMRLTADKQNKIISIQVYLNDNRNQNVLNNNNITSLAVRDSLLWITTFGGGLKYSGINDSSDELIFYSLETENLFSSNLMTSIAADSNNNLWIGTFGGGLNRYNIITGWIDVFKNTPSDPATIDNNDIISIAADRGGIIWIGTGSGYGINKLIPERIKFDHYKNDPLQASSLSDNVVTAFAEDNEGNLWIGTLNGGLNKFNRQSNTFSVFRHNTRDNRSISSNYITSLLAAKDKKIWIGTYSEGLNVYDPVKKTFTKYYFSSGDKYGLSSDKVTSIAEDKDGSVWIGTSDAGLNKVVLDKANNIKFIHYQSSPIYPGTISGGSISKIFVDEQETLWAFIRSGLLCRYNNDTEEFISYKISNMEKSDLSVLPVFLPDSDFIWIGTNGNGLIKFDIKSNRVSDIVLPHGLRNKSILAILKNGNDLWLSTNHGMIKYNLSSGFLSIYNMSEGIQSLKFTLGAAIKTRDGEFCFGGINGFNCFYPDRIFNRDTEPRVFITSLKAADKEITLNNSIASFSSSQNPVTIEFASFDFTDASRNQYLYILEGFDREWKYISSNDHSVSYEVLPPGEYLFKLKGANSAGVWNQKPLIITIIVSQVFWKTWWFILLVIITIGGILFYLIYLRINSYLEIEKLKTKLSADLHDSVGSGLTEISLLSEIIRRDYSKDTGKDNPALNIISGRARELVDNMSDIIWLVNPKPNTIHDLVLRLKEIYAPLMSSLCIKFKVDFNESLKSAAISLENRQHLYLIFKEAINNSMKYSNAKNIIFKIESDDGTLDMQLKDDGCGFNIGTTHGNGLNNMINRAKIIKADLKIRTAPGEGTSVNLTLNL